MLRKTKMNDDGRHYFGNNGGESELPWRKWVRANLPRGFEGFCVEDVDGVVICFDPKAHTNQALILLEIKEWGVQLDRSQLEMLKLLDRLLRAGDPRRALYRGTYIVEWHSTAEFVRVNYRQPLSHERFREFLLGRLALPSYFD